MELLDVIMPLYKLNYIFCARKFSIRNNSVYTIAPIQMAFTCVANFILIYLYYSTFQNTDFKTFPLKVYYFGIYGQHLLTFLVISLYNMSLRKVYFALIKKLQQIYQFESHLLSPHIMRRRLRISCGVLLYLYIGVIGPKLVLDPYWNWTRALFLALTIIIDIEMMFIIFVIRLLAFKTKSWAQVAHKLFDTHTNIGTNTNGINPESRIAVQDLQGLADDQHDVIEQYRDNEIENDTETKALFTVFNQLVDGTDLMKKAFQFTIFFHAFTLFTQSIVYIGVLILWIKQAEYEPQVESSVLTSHSTGIVVWIAKALALQAAVACASEQLYAGARAARVAACLLVAGTHDVSSTRSAKNALRVSALRSGALCAYALRVSAALPLRLAGLVAQYTVVLLQFALL